jgi:hypothetical protein
LKKKQTNTSRLEKKPTTSHHTSTNTASTTHTRLLYISPKPYYIPRIMAEMNQSTVAHSKEDIANNPGHVQAQQLEAMTPAATRPTSPAAEEDEDEREDKGPKVKSTSRKPKQKKIAVLTSGGDSAGMNAAGRWSWQG